MDTGRERRKQGKLTTQPLENDLMKLEMDMGYSIFHWKPQSSLGVWEGGRGSPCWTLHAPDQIHAITATISLPAGLHDGQPHLPGLYPNGCLNVGGWLGSRDCIICNLSSGTRGCVACLRERRDGGRHVAL